MSVAGGQHRVPQAAELVAWLLEAAYPLWASCGLDAVHGGFHERLSLGAEPTGDAKRARVQPRQIFAFARAPALGWKGDAAAAAAHGLRFLLQHYRRPDGLLRTLVSAQGTPLDERALLYDQAFALLAFATAAPLMPLMPLTAVGQGGMDLAAQGEQLRCAIYTRLKRAGLGFETGLPREAVLLANPHMHLLEAALAWMDAGGGPQWRMLADELGELALSHLIDPATAMAHECFDARWRPTPDASGRLVQPGHQFEWAWLLLRWGAQRADAREAALRLMDLGERYGVRQGVVINAVWNDGRPQDLSARLWPQAERLRAAALAARLYGAPRYWEMAAGAAAALLRYLQTPVRGLWHDRLLPSGDFAVESVTAGNLYHIVGAIAELAALIDRHDP